MVQTNEHSLGPPWVITPSESPLHNSVGFLYSTIKGRKNEVVRYFD